MLGTRLKNRNFRSPIRPVLACVSKELSSFRSFLCWRRCFRRAFWTSFGSPASSSVWPWISARLLPFCEARKRFFYSWITTSSGVFPWACQAPIASCVWSRSVGLKAFVAELRDILLHPRRPLLPNRRSIFSLVLSSAVYLYLYSYILLATYIGLTL